MGRSTVLAFEKEAVVRLLHQNVEFADHFVSYALARTIRAEEDLVDQLFNSTEKRLARVLMLLANFGQDGKPHPVIPKDQSGNSVGDGWRQPLSGEFLPEQVQGTWLH